MPGPELGGGHEATRVFRFCRWCGGRLAAFGGCPTESGSPVGFVCPGSKEVAASRIDAIMSGLRVSGYAAPAQVELVARTADGDPARIAPLVEELIGKNVNVIIANGPPVLHTARAATRTIPIVALDLETDPVASGVATSLGPKAIPSFLEWQCCGTRLPDLCKSSQSRRCLGR